MTLIDPLDKDINTLAGSCPSSIKISPSTPYSPLAIKFLSILSSNLLKSSHITSFPDLATFAFWARSSNLARLSRHCQFNQRIGRGLAVHITPANVPINAIYSFAFGILSGNSNIVRFSSRSYPQLELFFVETNRLFECCEYNSLRQSNSLISYFHSESLNGCIMNRANVRLLWGSNNTISELRRIPVPPRCIDLTFPDRYSLCILSISSVLSISDQEIDKLALGLYNDVFLYDQNACSSPHLILWIGDRESYILAKKRLWLKVSRIAKKNQYLTHSKMAYMYKSLCMFAIQCPDVFASHSYCDGIFRIDAHTLPKEISRYRSKFGFFIEYNSKDIDALCEIVDNSFQTVTYYGVSSKVIHDLIISNGLLGVDRIVPVGRALEMDTRWDGYDLILSMSREIQLL